MHACSEEKLGRMVSKDEKKARFKKIYDFLDKNKDGAIDVAGQSCTWPSFVRIGYDFLFGI